MRTFGMGEGSHGGNWIYPSRHDHLGDADGTIGVGQS
jgi:hypothetical protein